ncbi:hypothetical protein OG533_05460 [Streptomyces sp. NBC_01186]|uniref:hypothetical protein n=1 Tax=Streptomyces sp. NBC_01186 TaxID=2903765 RepID=UPI002E14C4EA|nr:hypothetical protein OG533_05460 [Streptomyces sp. NBC_01186]
MTADAERPRTAPLPPTPPPVPPPPAGTSGATGRTGPAPGRGKGAPAAPPAPAGTSLKTERLLPEGRSEQLDLRLQHAVSTFVEDPRAAVREADEAFEEAANQLTETLAELRRFLRSGWHDQQGESGTEELRRALQQYRDNTQRLLRM